MARSATRTRDPDRRAKILVAAGDLISRNGYHAVSMAEIGRDAGIVGSGIYRHFDSKAAILVALFDDIIDRLIADQEVALAEHAGPRETLRRLVRGQAEFVVRQRALARVYHNEIGSLPAEDQVRLRRKQRLYLEEWVHLTREAHPDLDDAVARTLVHAAVGAVQSNLFHNVGLEADRLLDCLARAAELVLEIAADQ
ncbi:MULTISPECIES: TetR/AcrR family transcriptional regulator [Amycolatopsis]|uniref:TetR/AcrR family transcriptional regulator n=1 Tax=Amycolatopsis TaxID=1813 RepID=UPI00039C4862|nr:MULTISPECIES: TetR/AcrR family transcriptional regulator [Amycolatopsis]